jgi:Tol biopolymer transport system component
MATQGFRTLRSLLAAGLIVSPLLAQATERASVDSGGIQGNGLSFHAVISADGRYVAFQSESTDLVAADTNDHEDIFLRDRVGRTTRRMSLATDGTQANDDCIDPAISGDGRFIAFSSTSSSLIPSDGNGFFSDVFVRDRLAGTLEIVSVSSTGVQGNVYSVSPSISADGRFVAFSSRAINLVPGETNGSIEDIFVRDRQAGTTERVSVDSGGIQGDGPSLFPSISADGRYVAFTSSATNLVPGDTNGEIDVFVHDRQTGTTVRASVDSSGVQANTESNAPRISADGRFVVFWSPATNLVPGDTNFCSDVFVRDLQGETTERVSINTGEGQANLPSGSASISGDGRFVAFWSRATNLIPNNWTFQEQVYVRDRQLGTTEMASLDSAGTQANHHCADPSMSADGRWVAFRGLATNLVPDDTNGTFDSFVRDLEATSFTSVCDPGLGLHADCPCSNPPASRTRGCDNSSATGGAVLSASGVTHLSADTLVFTTSGEKPKALSIVLQGNGFVPDGVAYGQGIRCTGGALKRLYAKSALAGSITAPDFGAGDLSVSAQSAAKGDLIQPGQPRWYMVYYRDPIVLGGCPSSSTFNATQTGQVTWSP